jgi:hypothetical protein
MKTIKSGKCYILHLDQWPALDCLSDEQLGRLLRHICYWLLDESGDGNTEGLLVENDIKPLYILMKNQAVIDDRKYQQKCEKNRRNIMKRWGKNADDTNVDFGIQNNNNNNNNNNNKNNNNNNNKSSIAAVGISEPVANAEEAAAADSFYEKAEKEWMPWFNRLLDGYESQIPRLRMMTKPRAERLRELLEKYGRDVVAETFRKAAGSQFLNGRGTKNKFIAKFDWIIDEKHFLDILEGNFNG